MAVIYNQTENYLIGTWDSDLIYNYVGTYVHSFSGDDQISNGAPVALINGDDGNDSIVNYYGTQVYLDGGPGNDYVANLGAGISTIYGGYDPYTSYSDNDILVGNLYAQDVFIVGEYCGNDLIQNYESNDMILCATSGVYAPTAYVYGSDIIISGYNMSVTVQGGAYKQFNFGYTYAYGGFSFDTATDDPQNFWGGANNFVGTAEADNIFVNKGDGNALVFNTDSSDTVHLCDAALSDIVATSVSDNSIAVVFNTGEVAQVAATENLSPTFKLASGESFVYNRAAGSWQQK